MLEHFRGIEFVRISSLPEDQKEKIWQSFQQDKIIKIVRDQSLLNDCILYQDYVSWLNQSGAPTLVGSTVGSKSQAFSNLAYK
jgi:hypothetical protein